ncbi:MAG: hypothetical protein WCH21_10395, partial [Bacteroidota bacterium]
TGTYLIIRGLPFTSRSNTGGYYYVGTVILSNAGVFIPLPVIDGGGNTITFFKATSGAFGASNLSASGIVDVSFTYFTSL